MTELNVEFSKDIRGGGYTVMVDAVAHLDQTSVSSRRMGVLMSMIDLQDPSNLAEFDEARQGNETWDWWGNDEYVRGEGDLVHFSYSPNKMDIERKFITMTRFQLDAVIHDLYEFMETGSPAGGTYAEDGSRTPIEHDQR